MSNQASMIFKMQYLRQKIFSRKIRSYEVLSKCFQKYMQYKMLISFIYNQLFY